MANSTVVCSLKTNVIKAICKDSDICSLIGSSEYKGEELIGTHIFTFNKNPETITQAITFLTVLVNTQKRDPNGTFVTPKLIITIYSHFSHMDVSFAGAKQKDNRNDMLGVLIDEKFNDSDEYSNMGKLELISNCEGISTDEFLYRQLIFEGVDYDSSLCKRW